MKQSIKETATAAYARNASDLFDLAEKITAAGWSGDCRTASWGDVGDLAHARELMIRASVALGTLTEAQALAMGVTL